MKTKYRFNKGLRKLKFIALIWALNMLFNMVFPAISLALTSGPAAPEFSSFEPVATTNMVDPFTGDFTYNLPVLNIPGSDGGGYAMSLSYHSGATPEEEASWVGLGWTLNAGAINRSKNGLVDEFNGVEVKRYNQTTPVWSVSATGDFSIEAASQDQPKPSDPDFDRPEDKWDIDFKGPLELGGNGESEDDEEASFLSNFSATLSASVRYNNYQGFSRSNGYSVGFKGMASLNMSRSGGNTTFGISVNPLQILIQSYNRKMKKMAEEFEKTGNARSDKMLWSSISMKISEVERNEQRPWRVLAKFIQPNLSPSNANTFPGFSVARTIGRARNFSTSIEGNIFGVGLEGGYSGNFNYNVPIPENHMLAYGYLHNPNWSDYYDDDNKVMHHSFDDGTNEEKEKDSKIIADYSVERNTSFNKHDYYLGIPYNGADQFMVTGEGAMGGFRFYQENIGTYYPTPTTNKQFIFQGGVEYGAGQPIQVGLDVGIGFQRTMIGNWQKNKRVYNDDNNNEVDVSEIIEFSGTPYPRFNNDQGGELRYSETDEVQSAFFRKNNKKLRIEEDIANYDQLGIEFDAANNADVGRSSMIYYSYYNNDNIISDINGSIPFDQMPSTEEHRDVRPNDGIAEIVTFNPAGQKYVYGIPVYTRNNANLTVGYSTDINALPKKDNPTSNGIPGTVEMPLHIGDPKKNYSVSGDVIEEPYASTFLLTQITTPNYVDVNGNGPDEEDFGGWTKFLYRKKYGREVNTSQTVDNWYNHRAPYTGLFYNKGQVNQHYDQTGSVSRGEKEVYYTKAIETKTHIAFFITNSTTQADFAAEVDELTNGNNDLKLQLESYLNGSGEVRFDSHDAADLDANGMDPAAQGERGNRSLDKLERIVLFSKSRLDRPLTTTYFEYSYELCKGVPNNINSDGTGNGFYDTGKLTLKKVWTESEGVVRSKIAPYQFEYNYFDNYQQTIALKYPEIDNFVSQPRNENPTYDPTLLDPWGNYVDQTVSKEQRDKMRSWMSQREDPTDFDPAAWNLKRIILPSGGEIHVQYEQKDYEFVQDREVMTMVSLNLNDIHQNEMKYDENKYFLNLDDLSLQGNSEKEDYFKKLVRYYFEGTQSAFDIALQDNIVGLTDAGITPSDAHTKAYFRFLYSYWDNAPSLYYNGWQGKFISDFIDGYAPIHEIGLTSSFDIYIQFGGKKKNKHNTPRRICREKLLTQGGVGLNRNGGVPYNADLINHDMQLFAYHGDPQNSEPVIEEDGDNSDEGEILTEMKKIIKDYDAPAGTFINGVTLFGIKNPKIFSKKVCSEFDPELSAIKLPMFKAKKGGGVRVKRLLTYNPGIETGEESLYGTEYIYKMSDGSSSGVATYEPAGSRIENPMVDIMDRHAQTWFNKIISGRDRGYQEGPLGEMLYPGPSVSHRRVIMKNIHSGKSAPGFSVHEYLTCKEHPSVTVEHTNIHSPDSKRVNKQSEHYKKSKFSIPLGLFNYKRDNAWVTQGYVFKIDDRHGKLKKMATYSGNVNPVIPSVTAFHTLLSSTEYKYSDPYAEDPELKYVDGMNMHHNGTDAHFTLDNEFQPGQEEDITMYMGRVEDRTVDFSLELDINIWISTPPVLQLGFGATVNMMEQELSQHVTSKVLRKNSVLIEEVSFADGMTSKTEYLAFDTNTGNPVVTKTTDQYEGTNDLLKDGNPNDRAYYSLVIPASWVYTELGQKAVASNNFNLLSANTGNIVTYMENPVDKFTDDPNEVDPRYEIWDPYSSQLTEVIEATSTVMKKDRFENVTDLNGVPVDMNQVYANYGFDPGNVPVMNALNAFFYPVTTFTYTSEITSGNDDDQSYNGGITNSFEFFDWFPTTDLLDFNWANGWKYVMESTKFSPHGLSLEEKDILGIPSSAKIGYNNILPTIIAGNAEYETILFHDYELMSTPGITKDASHTGTKSLLLNPTQDETVVYGLKLTQRLIDNGGYFKVWLKSETQIGQENTTQPKISIGGNETNLSKVARVGEWTLYQCYIHDWGNLSLGSDINADFIYPQVSGEQAYIDDVCFHPLEAAVSCNVYDPASLRLIAQFGDQHFATKYEYNKEGQLVRTVIETERGEKTIQEQQYNVNRNVNNPN